MCFNTRYSQTGPQLVRALATNNQVQLTTAVDVMLYRV